MSTVIIDTKDKSELRLVTDLMKRLGIGTKILSDREKEDLGLSMMMKDVDRTKRVSRDAIMRNLRSK